VEASASGEFSPLCRLWYVHAMSKARRSQTYAVAAGRLFPRKSKIASWMLPVMVLRSDLWFELNLIGRDDDLIAEMNKSKAAANDYHARMYFFRGTARSLQSTRLVIQRLMGLRGFKGLLRKARARKRFDALNKTLNRAAQEIAAIRNSVGAHIEQDVADARRGIPDDEVLMVERADLGGLTPRLGAPFLSAALFGHEWKDVQEANAEAEARLKRMAEAGMAAFTLLDLVINVYLRSMPTT
jgi:hypothetical protein